MVVPVKMKTFPIFTSNLNSKSFILSITVRIIQGLKV